MTASHKIVLGRTINVSQSDATLWNEVEQLVGDQFSDVLTTAVREQLQQLRDSFSGYHEITVTVGEPDDGVAAHRQRFRGRWLVDPHELDDRGFVSAGIAVTARGNYAVFVEDLPNHTARLSVYESLGDLYRSADVPRELISMLAAAMGGEYVEDLDI